MTEGQRKGGNAPRIGIDAEGGKEWSYADLLEKVAQEQNLKLQSDAEDEPGAHYYPNVMRSMLARLEKYGRLANSRDFTQRSHKRRKSESSASSSADERFYDLSDGFLEAESNDSDWENETEFESAVKEGHYALSGKDAEQWRLNQSLTRTQSKPQCCKRKAKDISQYPDAIQRTLARLQSLYTNSRDEGSARLKGSTKLIKDALGLMLCDATVDRTELCLTLSAVSGKSLESIERQAEKQLCVTERCRFASIHSSNLRRLKSLVLAECKSASPRWSADLRAAYSQCVDSLQQSISSSNRYSAQYSRAKLPTELGAEEQKLEQDVREWSEGRFLIERREVQVAVVGHAAAASLMAFLAKPPSPPIVSFEHPAKARKFEDMPPYDSLAFQPPVIDLL